MKKLITAILVVFMMHSAAFAQATPAQLVDQLDAIPNVELIPLKRGAEAPITGVLLPPIAVASIVAEFESFGQRIQIEVEKCKADAAAQQAFQVQAANISAEADKKILTTQLSNATNYNNSLLKQLKAEEANKPSRRLWYILGVVTGVVVTGAAAIGIARAVK